MKYKVLNTNVFQDGNFEIVPIRNEDRELIRKWRNDQMYHLRQTHELTKKDQEIYFNEILEPLFVQSKPSQLLFSFLEKGKCVGYGGLVHINWIDNHCELSFIMDTRLEADSFDKYWTQYLKLIEKVAFNELGLHKINTYAFDLRPRLYDVFEKNGYVQAARLKEHCYFQGKYIDVVIHSKFS